MKTTPILVSKIRSNTTGIVKVEICRSISYRNPLETFLIPVTDAARDEYDPNSTKYDYYYRIVSKINKFVKDHNLPSLSNFCWKIHNNKIIPVSEIPAYRMI